MEPENTPTPTPNAERPSGGSAGPIIGTIVILIVIVLGALYFWGQGRDEAANEDQNVESIETQSNSDEVSDIEADLNATDTDVDAGVNE